MSETIDYEKSIKEAEEKLVREWNNSEDVKTYGRFVLEKAYEHLVYPEFNQLDFFTCITAFLTARIKSELREAVEKMPVTATEVASVGESRRWLLTIPLEQWVEIDEGLIGLYNGDDNNFLNKELEAHKNMLRTYLLDCLLKGDFK